MLVVDCDFAALSVRLVTLRGSEEAPTARRWSAAHRAAMPGQGDAIPEGTPLEGTPPADNEATAARGKMAGSAIPPSPEKLARALPPCLESGDGGGTWANRHRCGEHRCGAGGRPLCGQQKSIGHCRGLKHLQPPDRHRDLFNRHLQAIKDVFTCFEPESYMFGDKPPILTLGVRQPIGPRQQTTTPLSNCFGGSAVRQLKGEQRKVLKAVV